MKRRWILVALTTLALAAVVGMEDSRNQTRRASRARPFRNCGRDRSKALPDWLEQPGRHSSSADESAGAASKKGTTVRHGLFNVPRPRRPHAHGHWAVGSVPARRGSHRARVQDIRSRIVLDYKNGIRLSGMPAFGRVESDEHIWNLVHYVRTLRGGASLPPENGGATP